MGWADQYNFNGLVNEAEELVIREINRQLARRADLCTCQECILDIAAYALNKVTPRYRVALLDSVFADRNERSAHLREIRGAVSEAILKVKANPAHD